MHVLHARRPAHQYRPAVEGLDLRLAPSTVVAYDIPPSAVPIVPEETAPLPPWPAPLVPTLGQIVQQNFTATFSASMSLLVTPSGSVGGALIVTGH